jgi:hypothetical protein
MREKWFFPPHPNEVGLSIQQVMREFVIQLLPGTIFLFAFSVLQKISANFGYWGLLLQLAMFLSGIPIVLYNKNRLEQKYNRIQRKALNEYIMLVGFTVLFIWIASDVFRLKVWGGR